MRMLAVFLSIVPGAGHALLRKYRKSLALLILAAGTIAAICLSPWILFRLVAGSVYLTLVIGAGLECYGLAYGNKKTIDSPAYVIFLLLTTGFSALPLLWQSAFFSKRAKILWTIAVVLLALIFFGLFFFYGVWAEDWLNKSLLS